MNIYKTETEYTSDGQLYCSEIFVPGHLLNRDVIDTRALPNEVVSGNPELVVTNKVWEPTAQLHKESVRYYIENERYVDAVHRLMYLTLAMGVGNVDVFGFMKDGGLMHELLHLKIRYSSINVQSLINQATEFEMSVPGSFLWVLNQIKT